MTERNRKESITGVVFKLAGVLGIIVFMIPSALADMKIKARMSMGEPSAQGMAMDTVIYQKGARQRTEVNLPMGMSMITLYQCDQKRLIQMNSQCKTYMITAQEADRTAAPDAKSGKGGVVTITSNSVDTGERQQMFGHTARHIKSTLTFEPGPGACESNRMSMEMDGWYIDLASQLSCASGERAFVRMRPGKSGCQDQYEFKTTGGAAPGFPLKVTMKMNAGQGGTPFSMTQETLDLSSANLDASLFDVPAGFQEVNDQRGLMCMPGGISQILKSQVPPAQQERRADTTTQRTDALRIGVVSFQNKTGKALNQNQLRERLLENLTQMGADAVRLDSENPAEVQAEAKQKQCGFILYTDVAQLKEPSSKKRIGGLLGRAAGVGSGDAGGEATVEFRLVPTGEPRQILLSSSATGKAVSGDESVASALEREADEVMSQLRKNK